MGFFRQEYWSGVPFPSPGDFPDPEMEPRSPALQADSLLSEPPGNPRWFEVHGHKLKGRWVSMIVWFLLQWSVFWVQADETWEWSILRDSVCKEVFRVGDTQNLNCVKRKVKTWDHEKMLELMNLMEWIKLVDWSSEGSVLEGGEESMSLYRIWTPFFVNCFACWRWILVSLRTLVQSTPLLSPWFYSLHVLLVNKWTRGPSRVANSHDCRLKSDPVSYLPNVVVSYPLERQGGPSLRICVFAASVLCHVRLF